MRNSKQRNVIINIIQGKGTHFTADKVYQEARKKLPNISLGTVYRNLGQLVDNNILKTINVKGVIHYEAFLNNHQHFFCTTCNEVYDVEVDTEEFVLNINAETKHKVDTCQVKLFGTCEKCMKKQTDA